MNKHLRYLSYVVRHKWFVFIAGFKIGAPLWRLIIHDFSKFSPVEWSSYVDSFYSGKSRTETQDHFRLGWLHHLHKNKHHWLHWVLILEDGSYQTFPMPDGLIREMVADWMGAGRAITGRWDIAEWWYKNESNMKLHPETRLKVNSILYSLGVE